MRTPFKCPVCNGQRRVPRGFYDAIGVDNWTTSDVTPETCRTCNGSGIVWGEDITEVDFEDFQSDDFMYNPDNNDNTSVT